jgi:hypothetical protein
VFNGVMDKMNDASNGRSEKRTMAYEVGMQSVDNRAQLEGGITGMVNKFGRELSTSQPEEFELIARLSNWFERRYDDSDMYVDEDRRASKAFIKGAVTGLLVADDTYANVVGIGEILDVINIKDAPTLDTTSSLGPREALNEALADIGRRGFDNMQEARQFIERWENECVSDYSYHFYYRLGFGLIMTSANKVAYDKSIEMLRHDAESGEIDWDKELQGILDGES